MSTPTAVFASTSLTAVGRQHMMSQHFWYFHLDKADYNNHYDNPQLSIQSLLDSPNPNSPANAEAAKLFVQSPAEYRYSYGLF